LQKTGRAGKLGGGGRHKFGALGVDGSIILKSEGRVFEGADWTDMLPVVGPVVGPSKYGNKPKGSIKYV